MVANRRDAVASMAALGIAKVDTDTLSIICDDVVGEGRTFGAVEDVKKLGKQQAIGALVGQAKKRNPNANPNSVKALCLEIIEKNTEIADVPKTFSRTVTVKLSNSPPTTRHYYIIAVYSEPSMGENGYIARIWGTVNAKMPPETTFPSREGTADDLIEHVKRYLGSLQENAGLAIV